MKVVHCALAITRALRYDISAKHYMMHNCKLPSLPLSCTGYNFYQLNKVKKSTELTTYLRIFETSSQLLIWPSGVSNVANALSN